ncbi:MAG: hypothetical protein P4L99_12375 [Chthoniobacter sp.]|nr:hypothetical protein [Chthoniobacter sp.]
MDPSFFTVRQAGAFALLLLALLLLPALLGKGMLPDRVEVYSSLSTRYGPFHYVERQIFDETSDIDIAFVGSSHLLHGIDTPYVEAKLSEKLGRKAVVTTLGWGGAGFDGVYFVLRDLLRHRKAKVVVIYDECANRNPEVPQPICSHWFRYGEDRDLLAGLPAPTQLALYSDAILGLPRNLLSMVRSNLPTRWAPGKRTTYDQYYHSTNPAERLGSEAARLAYEGKGTFAEYTPPTVVPPSEVFVYHESTRGKFRFTGPGTPDYQLHFAQRVAAMARAHGTTLVILHLPDIAEKRSTTIDEREDLAARLPADITLLGVPPAALFAGLTDADVTKLYSDATHFNQNGQQYFTSVITPALLEIYDSATAAH